jgi:hypothetical protein
MSSRNSEGAATDAISGVAKGLDLILRDALDWRTVEWIAE